MHARAPVYASRSQIASGQPLIIKVKRGGTGGNSGSGPTGYKATARAILSRNMADRPNVALVVKQRQALATAANKLPPKIMWLDAPTPDALAIYHR